MGGTSRGSEDRRTGLFLPWVVLAVACTVRMWIEPGEETIPYHVAWIGFALAYGFDPWPRGRTVLALATYTAATGGILVTRAVTGVIAWEETGEIPLMCVLVALMVWHVQRRQAALAAVTRMAERDAEAARQRERLSQLTTHEMRTPLTIATGYVEVLLDRDIDPRDRVDLEVVRDELGRLSRAGDRLLRMIKLQDLLPREPVDVDRLLLETAQRWAAVASRDWVVDSDGGDFVCSTERVRACFDTLIENAVRYTKEGDTIRLFSHRAGGQLLMGLADSGPGLPDALVDRINGHTPTTHAGPVIPGIPDPRSQTGLGLGFVQEAVLARGGRVVAGRSTEGGALMTMVLPESPSARPAGASYDGGGVPQQVG